MQDSMAHPPSAAAVWPLPGWKASVSAVAAILLAILFVVAGVWKITDPFAAAGRMAQAQVPVSLSLLAACAFGVAETFSGVLLVVPRFRRWGALLAGVLLVAFMIYIGALYNVLRGEDCNCFPWVKRAVGPAFFIGDAIMLGLAFLAWLWARRSEGLRTAALILLAVGVFAAVSYGVNAQHQAGAEAPQWIHVDGKPVLLRQGRVFLYFFDPECSHCEAAARKMATYSWSSDVRIVAVPTEQPQFAQDFLRDTRFRAGVSNDLAELRKSFSTILTPYAIALENGRRKEAFSNFDAPHPDAELRQLGFIR